MHVNAKVEFLHTHNCIFLEIRDMTEYKNILYLFIWKIKK